MVVLLLHLPSTLRFPNLQIPNIQLSLAVNTVYKERSNDMDDMAWKVPRWTAPTQYCVDEHEWMTNQ